MVLGPAQAEKISISDRMMELWNEVENRIASSSTQAGSCCLFSHLPPVPRFSLSYWSLHSFFLSNSSDSPSITKATPTKATPLLTSASIWPARVCPTQHRRFHSTFIPQILTGTPSRVPSDLRVSHLFCWQRQFVFYCSFQRQYSQF